MSRRWMKSVAITAVCALSTLAVTGCGSGSGDSSSATSTPTVSESVSAQVSGDSGSVKSGSDLDLPADWPAQLPLPDGVSVNNIADSGSGSVVTAATTFTSIQDCVFAFQSAWSKDGVTIKNVVSTSVGGALKAELSGGKAAALAVTMTGDTATVVITLSS